MDSLSLLQGIFPIQRSNPGLPHCRQILHQQSHKKLKFYEDLQELLELTAKTDVLFIIGDWNAKAGSQEIPGVTPNLALEYRIKQGKG